MHLFSLSNLIHVLYVRIHYPRIPSCRYSVARFLSSNPDMVLYVYMFERGRYQYGDWHVMCDASDVKGCDRRRAELAV